MTEETRSMALDAERLRSDLESLNSLADSFGQKIVTAFSSAIIHGKKFSDVLRDLMLSLAQTALSAALRPLGQLTGGLFGGAVPNAKGNVFSHGAIQAFSSGGIVNSPTLFPMRGATGLMGEAGPEAIMPLARGADGKLGVRGGGSVNVTVNISTPDARSFEQSQSQIAAMLSRAVARGYRNL